MAKTSPTPNASGPEPTEQLPTESAPVSARSAASGGATGLPDGDFSNGKETSVRGNASLFRRHPIASGIVAGSVAVILVAGLTAWGVGTAVTASLTSSTSGMSMGASAATATPALPATGKQAGGAKATGRLAFRATIQSMDGASWTILTRKGETVTVTVDSSTQFGTRKVPETASNFAVGDEVIVVATAGTTAGSATATRVVNSADIGNGTNTTPNPTITSPPSA